MRLTKSGFQRPNAPADADRGRLEECSKNKAEVMESLA